MTGGNAVHHVTITAKDPGTVINSVEAVVAGWGEYYDRVGVTAGDKVETGPVDDNTVVTVENINAGTFSFQGGIEAVVFTDLTVYYTSTAYSCEHTFGDDYRNDGETHSRKCTKCGEFVGGEAHTFTKHECACGATETTKMTETLPFSGSAFNEDGYLYKGTNFTVSGTATDTLAYGLTIGNGNKMTITANDPTLTIERIEAELVMGGRDYLFIEVSSGEKLEKGSVEAPSTIHVINVNASSFTFSGSAGKNACKLEDITVYYTDGKIAHVLSDECVDNGDGTHTYCCTKCDDYGVTEDHTFVNGVCVCGAEDPSEFVVNEEGVLIAYNGEGGDVVIPDDMGITAINNSVFATNETLTSVVIPDGVTRIGKAAFMDCVNLKSVTIPEGLTTILSEAFSGCESLTTVYIACGADAAAVADMIDSPLPSISSLIMSLRTAFASTAVPRRAPRKSTTPSSMRFLSSLRMWTRMTTPPRRGITSARSSTIAMTTSICRIRLKMTSTGSATSSNWPSPIRSLFTSTRPARPCRVTW